jgi:hypothetical protein
VGLSTTQVWPGVRREKQKTTAVSRAVAQT